PHPASAAPALAKALLIPLRQRALGLKAPPAPGHLNGHRAAVRVASLGDALRVGGGAPRGGGGWRAARAPYFFPIAKRPPAAALHHKQPGTLEPNPFEPQEL